jgi:hypothetical protein
MLKVSLAIKATLEEGYSSRRFMPLALQPKEQNLCFIYQVNGITDSQPTRKT